VLWVGLHFPRLRSEALARGHARLEPERAALESVAMWLGRFTPRVSLEPPQGVAAEVAGSLRLFGGAADLAARIRAGLTELGFDAVLALAPTARAALWRAAAGGLALEALPVAVTGAAPEALELASRLGVRTLGDLARLPRDGVALRFGPALLGELDRALGRAPEARVFFVPPARFDARLELPAQVTQAESVLFVARRLLAQLEGFLTARHAGARGFTLALLRHDGGAMRLEVALATPHRDAAHFAMLARERLARTALAAPVEAVRLEAADLAPLPGDSGSFLRDARSSGEDWARLVERLQARLGGEAVHGLALHAEHRPELAWRPVGPPRTSAAPPARGATIRRPSAAPLPGEPRSAGPRPLWLIEPPRRLAENDFMLLAGPERIESGWWDGAEARRDYFIARSDASLLWIYREREGGWFLHGIFA
jgi:protein ImuB